MSINRNLVANFSGQAWAALIGIAFVPLYVRYLGVEGFALVGFFTFLFSVSHLLDLGLKPALAREVALFTAGRKEADALRDLFWTASLGNAAIACLILLCMWFAADQVASNWLQPGAIGHASTRLSVQLIGIVIALRFLEGLYITCLIAFQRQVLQNVMTSSIATVRTIGAILVLALLSPTVEAFFLWQIAVSAVSLPIYAFSVWRILPTPSRRPRASLRELRGVWRFAAGMTGITILGTVVTHADKILLSTLLPLEEYGVYALAAMIVLALGMFTRPVYVALQPRMTELAARGDEVLFARMFHVAAQLVTATTGSAGLLICIHGEPLVFAWTGDATLSSTVYPLLSVLAAGQTLNALMTVSFVAQLAHAWTSLGLWLNVIAALLIVPGIVWLVPTYGAFGAAWLWLTVNLFYFLVGPQIMHSRILKQQKLRWYLFDVIVPVSAAAIVALSAGLVLPSTEGRTATAVLLLLVLAFSSSAAVLTSADLRRYGGTLLRSVLPRTASV